MHTCLHTHAYTHVLSHAHTRSYICAHSHTRTGPVGGSLNSTPCLLWSPQLLPCCSEPRQVLGRIDQTQACWIDQNLPSCPRPKRVFMFEQRFCALPAPRLSSHSVGTFKDLPSPSLLPQGRPLDPHNALQPTPSCPHCLWLDCLCP